MKPSKVEAIKAPDEAPTEPVVQARLVNRDGRAELQCRVVGGDYGATGSNTPSAWVRILDLRIGSSGYVQARVHDELANTILSDYIELCDGHTIHITR